MITDEGSVFVFQVIHEIAEILSKNLKHATTKHAQTIGVLERAHATIETSSKMTLDEYRKQSHRYLPIAILKYNTTPIIPVSILNQSEFFMAEFNMTF